jgi:CDGSH-type Zn-finger protein
MKKKINCIKCNKDAVIIENKIYFCGSCAVEQFIDGVHKRLRFKPNNNSNQNAVERKQQ